VPGRRSKIYTNKKFPGEFRISRGEFTPVCLEETLTYSNSTAASSPKPAITCSVVPPEKITCKASDAAENLQSCCSVLPPEIVMHDVYRRTFKDDSDPKCTDLQLDVNVVMKAISKLKPDTKLLVQMNCHQNYFKKPAVRLHIRYFSFLASH